MQDFEQPEPDTGSRLLSAFSSCLYAGFVIAVSGGLLLVNAILCLTIYAALPKYENAQLAAGLGQFFFFLVPVLLLVVEWNLIDRLQRLFDKSS